MDKYQEFQPLGQTYEPGEGYFTASPEKLIELEERDRQHLAEVIRTATEQGKEPFDYAKFVEMYWYKDAQSNGLTGK